VQVTRGVLWDYIVCWRVIAVMHHEVEPLTNGNQSDKKAETFGPAVCFCCILLCPCLLIHYCLFGFEKPQNDSPEQAKRSLLKTQVNEVCHQLDALNSNRLYWTDNMATC
jgi:hypothetical protein